MVVSPGAAPVTTPLPETVATVGEDEDQVASTSQRSVSSLKVAQASRVTDSPTIKTCPPSTNAAGAWSVTPVTVGAVVVGGVTGVGAVGVSSPHAAASAAARTAAASERVIVPPLVLVGQSACPEGSTATKAHEARPLACISTQIWSVPPPAEAIPPATPGNAGPIDRVVGLSPVQIQRRFTAAARAAGIEARVTAHSGRVGLASELTARGASTTEVMLAGNWKTARMVALARGDTARAETLDRDPEIHLGRASWMMLRTGEANERTGRNEQIAEGNREREQERAAGHEEIRTIQERIHDLIRHMAEKVKEKVRGLVRGEDRGPQPQPEPDWGPSR